jgi:hypothetical protein
MELVQCENHVDTWIFFSRGVGSDCADMAVSIERG